MSEKTIEKLDKSVDWNEIFKYQTNLTSEFVIKHIEKITDCRVMFNLRLSDDKFNKLYRRIKFWYRARECWSKT